MQLRTRPLVGTRPFPTPARCISVPCIWLRRRSRLVAGLPCELSCTGSSYLLDLAALSPSCHRLSPPALHAYLDRIGLLCGTCARLMCPFGDLPSSGAVPNRVVLASLRSVLVSLSLAYLPCPVEPLARSLLRSSGSWCVLIRLARRTQQTRFWSDPGERVPVPGEGRSRYTLSQPFLLVVRMREVGGCARWNCSDVSILLLVRAGLRMGPEWTENGFRLRQCA